MLSFCPVDVSDEMWDVIDSVSVGFLTYSLSSYHVVIKRKTGLILGPADALTLIN